MEKVKAFCKRKNIEISVKRYLIDALGAMAQGLFASLLIGTIISTLGTQLNIPILVTVGTYAKAAVGPAMAIAIGYALQAAPLVLFSLAAVGAAANELGGAGGLRRSVRQRVQSVMRSCGQPSCSRFSWESLYL